MVNKQQLLLFLKNKGDDIKLTEIEEFVNAKNPVTLIGFTKGAMFIDSDSPTEYLNSIDLAKKLKELNLSNDLIVEFNAVSQAKASLALIVIRIMVEILRYRIAKITATNVRFVK